MLVTFFEDTLRWPSIHVGYRKQCESPERCCFVVVVVERKAQDPKRSEAQ